MNQLRDRYQKAQDPSMARGLLVLSTSKLFNSQLGVLEADTHEQLGQKASAYNEAFIEHNRQYWQVEKDQKTLGAAIVFDTPSLIGMNKILVTCHEVAMNNAVPVDTSDYHLLHRVAHEVFAIRT